MQEIKISDIVKSPLMFREALEKGTVKIVWKEQRPNGKVLFSALCTKQEIENVDKRL